MRTMALSIAGTILSQLPMPIQPSQGCAPMMVSIWSVINSREGSEYFMPKCPMAMPSQIAAADVRIPDAEAQRLEFLLQHRAQLVQVRVARDLRGVGVDDRDDGLREIVEGADQPLGLHQRRGRQHLRAVLQNAAAAFTDFLDALIHNRHSLSSPHSRTSFGATTASVPWRAGANQPTSLCALASLREDPEQRPSYGAGRRGLVAAIPGYALAVNPPYLTRIREGPTIVNRPASGISNNSESRARTKKSTARRPAESGRKSTTPACP